MIPLPRNDLYKAVKSDSSILLVSTFSNDHNVYVNYGRAGTEITSKLWVSSLNGIGVSSYDFVRALLVPQNPADTHSDTIS